MCPSPQSRIASQLLAESEDITVKQGLASRDVILGLGLIELLLVNSLHTFLFRDLCLVNLNRNLCCRNDRCVLFHGRFALLDD